MFHSLGPYEAPWERGESIVAGQVAIAIDRGGRRTTPTGGAGFPISGWPSGSLDEDARGAREGCPFPRAPQVVGEARERGENGAQLSKLTAA